MTLLEAAGLGIIQGFTEFLPVSSKGHLSLAQVAFGIEDAGVFFDILLHLGTLLATTIYYRREWGELLGGLWRLGPSRQWLKPATYVRLDAPRFLLMMVLASVPTAFVGLFTKRYLESTYENPLVIGAGFLLTALILATTYWTRRGERRPLSFMSAVLIGLAQGVATLPGVSRSGSTIAAALARKAEPEEAARFSFFIAYPAILGAVLLKSRDVVFSQLDLLPVLVGFTASAIVGYLALGFLTRVLRRGLLHGFVAWVLASAALSFLTAYSQAG